ncbi:DNA-binding response regulator [Spirochaetia bacterium]|nr:DNA-binding response regulator [Spirochaetia bacterium]
MGLRRSGLPNNYKTMIKLIVIDDRERDLQKICSFLYEFREFHVIGRYGNAYDAANMKENMIPDVIILGINDSADQMGVITLLKKKYPHASVIMLSSSNQEQFIRLAISNKVSGYLLKSTDMDKLASTIRTIFRGGYFISPLFTPQIIRNITSMTQGKGNSFPLSRSISQTESRILKSIARGYSNKEIAEELSLKYGTVRNYVSSVLKKAGLRSRTQVAAFISQYGIPGQEE